jgi:hypothetical protein
MSESLSFYDVKNKKKFNSANYKVVTKSGRKFAVATGPKGNECWRILGK